MPSHHTGTRLMTNTTTDVAKAASPLHNKVFRRIWASSLLSNLGLLIQGVGAAWAMTGLTRQASMVTLVQTANFLPMALLALIAGALADMFDRRRIAIIALSLSLSGTACLTALFLTGTVTPWLLLGFCFVIGTGTTMFSPAWQASVPEQVGAEALPAAIALNSISYNVARSLGPAVGGTIVAAFGAIGAFAAAAMAYMPLLLALLLWKRVPDPARMPPERIGEAIVAGARYVFHSPNIRVVLARTVFTGMCGSAIGALMPLVARELLHGGAPTYGFMLGGFGLGAIGGAASLSALRTRCTPEALARTSAVIMAAGVAGVALSMSAVLTAAALVAAGYAWILSITTYNMGVQLAAPRWVAARALALFNASIAGGIAFGSWLWGHVAQMTDVRLALLASAAVAVFSGFLGVWLRLPPILAGVGTTIEPMLEPDIRLPISKNSGPVLIEIEYRVPTHDARAFYGAIQKVRSVRARNGAYEWRLARDLADPELWVERFQCPTWADYLRQRNRTTLAEREIGGAASAFHTGGTPVRVRRLLGRPMGSVRWHSEVPDRGITEISQF